VSHVSVGSFGLDPLLGRRDGSADCFPLVGVSLIVGVADPKGLWQFLVLKYLGK
jgi:hypothetical protein